MAERRRSPVAGVVTLAAGAVLMIVVMAANAGGTPALEALAHRLGLAWAPLLLAFGIALSLTGLWLLWRGRDRPEE